MSPNELEKLNEILHDKTELMQIEMRRYAKATFKIKYIYMCVCVYVLPFLTFFKK